MIFKAPSRTSPGAGRQRGAVLFHGAVLAVCSVVLIMAFCMESTADGVGWHSGWRLPELCVIQRYAGFPCPGCGLTRCFVRAVHGDWAGAIRANFAGLFVLAMVAFQLPYRALQINRLRRGRAPYSLGRLATVYVWMLLSLLLLQWALAVFAS